MIRRAHLLPSLAAIGVLLISSLAGSAVNAAGAGTAFTYQGQLSALGAPVTDTCDFAFTLWDDLAAGLQVGSTISQTLGVTDGLFVTLLDFGSASWTGDARWLDISVGCPVGSGLTTLAPRQQLAPTPYAIMAGAAPWAGLAGVPAGFADGVDDVGPTYTNGTGLTLVGGQFAIDPAAVQTRVSGVCAAGSSIRAIAQDGSVTCQVDTDTDTNTTYTAGAGLQLIGTEFSVLTSTVQTRVTGTCAAGSSIASIAADGSVSCETDDTGASYTAGSNVVIAGNVISVPTIPLSSITTPLANTNINLANKDVHWVFSNPSGGMHFDWQGAASGHLMEIMTTGGNVQAGTHLLHIESDSANAVPLHAKTVAGAQALKIEGWSDMLGNVRVGGYITSTGAITAAGTISASNYPPQSCAAGSSISAISSTGAVTCETDDNSGGDITSVTAGSGLSGGGTTGAVTLTVPTGGITSTHVLSTQVQLRASGTCAAGSSIRVINADGTVSCETDDNSGGTVTGTATAGQVAYWGGSGYVSGDSGATYDASGDVLTLAGGINTGTYSGATTGQAKISANKSDYALIVRQSSASGYGATIHPGSDSNAAFAVSNTADTLNRHVLFGNGDAYFGYGSGNVGIGTAAMSGRLDVRGANEGGFIVWDTSALNGSTQTILSGVSVSGISGNYVCSGTSTTAAAISQISVSTSAYACGGLNQFTISLAGTGVAIYRSSGSSTLHIMLTFTWK